MNDKRPTIAELEKILARDDGTRVKIEADGSIYVGKSRAELEAELTELAVAVNILLPMFDNNEPRTNLYHKEIEAVRIALAKVDRTAPETPTVAPKE